jgi:hypothetical protein
MKEDLELKACTPHPLHGESFNFSADLPYGLEVDHVRSSMNAYIDFLGFINQQLHTRGLQRFEKMIMPANFSSMVGEFMGVTLPKFCPTIAKNNYHNGHPDIVPAGLFVDDAVQHSDRGIEIKASRYLRGWQGHNPEDTWLMVFVFDSNRPVDQTPKPFRFIKVVGARLVKSDWNFAGRKGESRRTITASVTKSGYEKMTANWLYQDFDLPKL